jgi:HEAT repeat protein
MIRWLGRMRMQETAPHVARFLNHGESLLRMQAAHALAAMGAAGWRDELAVALSDPDRYVQLAAAEALLELGSQDEGLITVLAHLEREVDSRASMSLLGLGRKGRQAQFQLIEDARRRLRRHDRLPILEALAQAHEPATSAALRQEVEIDRPIETAADVRRLLADRSIELECDPVCGFWGRIRRGARLTLGHVVARLSGFPVIRGRTIRLMRDGARALASWEARLALSTAGGYS